jgi:hypothetical protein
MVDPHAAQAALRSRTGVCGYDAHRCSTRGKAQSCRPVSSPVDCDSLRPPASHHASHPDRQDDTFTRTVGDRGPRDRTVSLPPSHNCELVWRGPLRRRRSIYSQYVFVAHHFYRCSQSVSFVAVPPRAAAHLTQASAPLSPPRTASQRTAPTPSSRKTDDGRDRTPLSTQWPPRSGCTTNEQRDPRPAEAGGPAASTPRGAAPHAQH